MSHRDSPKVQGILKNEESQAVSPSALLGLQALSPRSGPKSVSIAPRAETISPLILGTPKDVDDLDLDRTPSGSRQRKARGPTSMRMSGRKSHNASITSLSSIIEGEDGPRTDDKSPEAEHHMFSSGLMGHVTAWIRDEKAKRHARKAKRKAVRHESRPDLERRSSESSDSSVDLSKLEQILKENIKLQRPAGKRRGSSNRRRPSVKDLHRASNAGIGASSDTDYYDGDILVPSADAWLDNTRTLAYPGALPGSGDTLALTLSNTLSQSEATRSKEAWNSFKFEIVRLTHTLRLKGWRRVPMDMSSEIDVERLSGALTNAVYVVAPPQNLSARPDSSSSGDEKIHRQRPPPPKLLLRIYGPQVEHLIDREAELQILRRLARKHIGPRMLGTFNNGRFEEFFHARALDPNEMRQAATSEQIAKRMRELHDGVELLERERDAGAFVWANWDKWYKRVEDVVTWLDQQVADHEPCEQRPRADAWKKRGHVCGTEWAVFEKTVKKYRSWLQEQYVDRNQLRERYVFAHNDTQYGNILRLLPTGTSPLLLPANTHKQLIVIDFEYASANTPGLEFANHFTEWCYNYHDPNTPWKLNINAYPTAEEQYRFVRAYVRHRPQFNVSQSSTPVLAPLQLPDSARNGTAPRRPAPPSHNISSFMLDARTPGLTDSTASLDSDSSTTEESEIEALLAETRLWRLANSAQWVAWGIVQAKVPGMPAFASASSGETTPTATAVSTTPDLQPSVADTEKKIVHLHIDENGTTLGSDPLSEESKDMRDDIEDKRPDTNEEGDETEHEEFDYLAYARSRAMFFWGDALELGLVREEELPEDVVRDVKRVGY